MSLDSLSSSRTYLKEMEKLSESSIEETTILPTEMMHHSLPELYVTLANEGIHTSDIFRSIKLPQS